MAPTIHQYYSVMFSNKVYSFYLHKLSLPDEKDKPLQHVSLYVNLFSFIREYKTILTSQLTKFSYLCYSLYQAVISICSFMWARQAFKAGIFGNPAQKVQKAIKIKEERAAIFTYENCSNIVNITFSVKSHIYYSHMQQLPYFNHFATIHTSAQKCCWNSVMTSNWTVWLYKGHFQQITLLSTMRLTLWPTFQVMVLLIPQNCWSQSANISKPGPVHTCLRSRKMPLNTKITTLWQV